MVTEQYSGNSIASKEKREEQKKEKVVTGNVTKKEKKAFAKFREDLGIGDTQTIFSYIVKEVLIPSFKKLISDLISNGTNLWLYGEPQKDRGRSRVPQVSYNSYYEYDDRKRDRKPLALTRSVYDISEVEFDEFADADIVLGSLEEAASKFDRVASVSDFYDLCGISDPGGYTSNRYGWTLEDIRRAEIKRTRSGSYYISITRPMALN